ncbi:hypothetical protein AA313_de0201331 [Arthrobotrys entomopaga]|nr:hypothetical protein AA313_de0201331 [Arthrobotrys entomopaga]
MLSKTRFSASRGDTTCVGTDALAGVTRAGCGLDSRLSWNLRGTDTLHRVDSLHVYRVHVPMEVLLGKSRADERELAAAAAEAAAATLYYQRRIDDTDAMQNI